MIKLKYTTFIFFKNTPLNDLINTIHFKSDVERDTFFLYQSHYETVSSNLKNYNFVRDRLLVSISCTDYNDYVGVNYCTFFSDFDKRRYYAFVTSVKYNNNGMVRVQLMIDVVMTFTQGRILEQLNNLTIIREHLSNDDYKKYLPIISTNDDIIKTTTKKYIYQDLSKINADMVLFQSTVDLSSDFGSTDDPKITTSSGMVFDNLVSPVNLYCVEYNRFQGLMEILKGYPWIAQNLSQILLISSSFIGSENYEPVNLKDDDYEIFKLKDGGKSTPVTFDGIALTINQLMLKYGLKINTENHLLRDGYVTLEMYSWDGQSVLLNPAFLDSNTGLKLQSQLVTGYQNEVRVFPLNYSSFDNEKDIFLSGENPVVYKGTYLNNAFIFESFSELPILIDNYKLGMAKNANQRELSESKLLTNRVENIFDDKANIQDRFFNAMSVFSDMSPSGIMGKFTDEYEFYRNQKAQFADQKLQTPTITNQSKGNSFGVANDNYGITLKLSAPCESELNKIRIYYKILGYEVNLTGNYLSNVESMRICNYLQFKGNFILDNIPVEYIEMLKPLFENGIRFWHNKNLANPMQQDIMSNEVLPNG